MTTEQTDLNLQDGMLRQHAKYQAAMMAENIQAVMFVMQLWWLCIQLHSYTGWIMLRRRFGERFLPTRVILFCSFTSLMAASLAGSTIGLIFSIGVFLMACIHRVQIMWRNKRGEIWHSREYGTSYLIKKFPEHEKEIEDWVEPAIVMAAGLLLMLIPSQPFAAGQVFWSGAFGLYVASVGFAMLLQANKIKRDARNLRLDQRDSWLENQAFAAQQDRDMEDSEVDALLAQSSVVESV